MVDDNSDNQPQTTRRAALAGAILAAVGLSSSGSVTAKEPAGENLFEDVVVEGSLEIDDETVSAIEGELVDGSTLALPEGLLDETDVSSTETADGWEIEIQGDVYEFIEEE